MTLCEKCKKNQIPAYRKKYCDGCAKEIKENYEQNKEAEQAVKNPVKPGVSAQPESARSDVYHHNIRPNSYEFGPANNRHKVYYEDIEDLKKQVSELKEAGFGVDE